ncbi:MAG TPA: nucleotidyltransferase family protein [Nitrospirae bacterium]|nr:UTP--glucose-1-phosphate uridylyltransferase [bacterium BMS3Abin06]HDH12900.1 nucleotidyltransferase family protein [Nitrospirota bacterium]HDZ01688.1 nucleotidyltransferase family protein [Nitrospirota bacterium]
MKALILAGGRGKRLDEYSMQKNKCMIEVNGRPVIEYGLDCAVNTDVDEIIIVVGFRASEIINTYGIKYKNKNLKYIVQQEQRGLVHAMECCREELNRDDFILLLGDEILINPKHQELINEFKRDDFFAICGVLKVEDKNLIKRTYNIVQDDKQLIYRLIEKPRNPLNNIMGTGDCVFKNEILSYIEYTPTHHERGEKELPDLIQCAIDDGNKIKSFFICDKYTNINSKEDMLIAEGFFK